jgi:hypothetical protein
MAERETGSSRVKQKSTQVALVPPPSATAPPQFNAGYVALGIEICVFVVKALINFFKNPTKSNSLLK